ncbi:MAG: hypothetical protein ACR2KL_02355 [Nocardioidaceae bacterium]
MASIEKRTHGGTVTWVARWRDPAGRQRKRSHPRKSDAERFLATVEADKARGVYIDHSTRVTVTEYARAWAETRPHRSFTAARVSSLSEVHIAGTSLGGRRQAAGGWWTCDRPKCRRGPPTGRRCSRRPLCGHW